MSLMFRTRPSLPGATPGNDETAELERLTDLHAHGALTDDEFAAAKARVLGLPETESRTS
jgi:hypothetical protein